jgi:hypothetical protein
MTTDIISADRFAERLAVLCVNAQLVGLPRRREDRLILLKSIAMGLAPDAAYTEKDVNAVIQQWLLTTGHRVALDYVTLRRALVDEGLIVRDAAGATYRLRPGVELSFAPDVDDVDVLDVLAAAEATLAERKAERAG